MLNNPIDNQILKLAQPFNIGDTSFVTDGRFSKTSEAAGTKYKIGKQIMGFSLGQSQSKVELAYIDVTADPTVFDAEQGWYSYDLATVDDRGLDYDNTNSNLLTSQTSLQRTHKAGSSVGVVISGVYYAEILGAFDSGTVISVEIEYGEAIAANKPVMISTVDKKLYLYDGTYPLKGVSITGGVSGDTFSYGTWGYLSTGYAAFDGDKKVYADSATSDWTQTSSATTVLAGNPEVASGGDFTSFRMVLTSDALAKASTAEAEAGVNDENYMTPLKTKESVIANQGATDVVFGETLTAGDFIRLVDNAGIPNAFKVAGLSSGTADTVGTGISPYGEAVYDIDNDRVLYVYSEGSGGLYAVVGELAGETMTLGTPVAVDTNGIISPAINVAYNTADGTFLIAWGDGTDLLGEARVATIDPSDNSVSLGAVSTFNPAQTRYISVSYDTNADKFLIGYQDSGGDTFVHTKVATVTGTSVAFGGEDSIAGSPVGGVLGISYDEVEQTHLLTYQDTVSTLTVATITGTNTTFAGSYALPSALLAGDTAYNTKEKTHLLAAAVGTNGTAYSFSVSGSTITKNDEIRFASRASNASVTYNSTLNRHAIASSESLDTCIYEISTQGGKMVLGSATIISSKRYELGVAAINKTTSDKYAFGYGNNTGGISLFAAVLTAETRSLTSGAVQVSGVATDTRSAKLLGTESLAHTGLQIGLDEYIDTAGVATETPNAFRVGRATDTTKILQEKITTPNTFASGVHTFSGSGETTITHGLKRTPQRIIAYPQDAGTVNNTPIVVGTPAGRGSSGAYAITLSRITDETFILASSGATNIYWTAE